MTYRLRDDVILEKVSGINLLISLRSAWGECPFALQIASVSAAVWEWMKAGMDTEEIITALMESRSCDRKKSERIVESFVLSAEKLHYLLPEEPGC